MRLLGLFALTVFLGFHFVATRGKSASGRKSRNALVVQESLEARVRLEKSGRKKKKKVPIVPTGKKSKKGAGGKLGKGLVKQYKVAQTLLEKSADLTKGATNSVNRLIKSWLSSDFEKLLLSLTSPDDLRPQSRDVAEFLATVKSFMIDEDTSPLNEDNPYRVCLRKLNSKVCEPDGRTTLKALYVLHLVFKNSEGKDAALFKALFKKMRKERLVNKKKTTHFSMEMLTDCTLETQYLSDFIERYAEYVFKRGLFFTGASFKELQKVTDYTMRSKDICQVLFDAVKVLESALACGLEENADEDTELVYVTALSLVAEDAKALFELFYEKLRWVVREEEIGELFDRSEWKEEDLAAMLAMLKRFYTDTYPKLKAFLQDVEEVLSLYRPGKIKKRSKKSGKTGAVGEDDRGKFALLCPPAYPVPPPGGFTVEEEVDTGAAAGGSPEASVDVHVDVEEGD